MRLWANEDATSITTPIEGIYELPSELLLHTLSFIDSPKQLSGIAGANRGLRSLLVNVPELWSKLRLSDHAQWVSLCAARASETPLSIHVVIDVSMEFYSDPPLSELLRRTAQLEIEIKDWEEFELFTTNVAAQVEAEAEPWPLRAFILQFGPRATNYAGLGNISHAWLSCLRSLDIRSVNIESFPSVTTLVHLHLHLRDCEPDGVYALLLQNTSIQTIDFSLESRDYPWIWDIDEHINAQKMKTLRPASLSDLRSATVWFHRSESAVTFLGMIPDPSNRLSVTITPRKKDIPTALPLAAPVLDRLASF